MTAVWAMLLALGAQDPAAEDPRAREIETLRKENRDLRERLELLEQAALRDAETIQRLRTALKLLEARAEAPAPPEAPPPSAPPNAPKAPEKASGPRDVLRAKVVHVDPQFQWIYIDAGKPRVQAGYTFEIFRDVYENGNPEPKAVRLGAAEFEKYIGQEESMSKLRVIEGRAEDMKVHDDAVAVRALPPVAAKPPAEGARPAEPSRPGMYRITGRAGRGAGAGYTIDYGSAQGARQSDLLYFYKDGVPTARLRIDRVDRDFCVAHIVDGSLSGPPPEIGDEVSVREIKKALTGQVALSDEKRNLIAVNLRRQDGVKPGTRCEVRRRGQKVGTLLLTDVQVWGSWARPEGETRFEDIQRGDFVEVIEEKK
jgi:hypothetical protein